MGIMLKLVTFYGKSSSESSNTVGPIKKAFEQNKN